MFAKTIARPDGHQTYCRDCHSVHLKKSHMKYREERLQRMRDYYNRRKNLKK